MPPIDAGTPWDKCRLPDASPKTIQQVVDRINALPRPVDIPCVIAGLPRPLAVVASTSVFSAQPAEGRKKPANLPDARRAFPAQFELFVQ